MHPTKAFPHSRTNDVLYREIMRGARQSEELAEDLAASARIAAAATSPGASAPLVFKPLNGSEATNPLRPRTLDEMVGQDRLKPLMRRLIDSAQVRGEPMDHLLFVGASGTGKTTFATVIANEIGTRVFSLKAPLDMDALKALREQCRDRDVIFLDEIHLQTKGDRRGQTAACDEESFFTLLEDGVLSTEQGPLPFPKVTWIGATTDVGLLPEPLSNRFAIPPRLSPYSDADMRKLAAANATALRVQCSPEAVAMFAGASRGIPRQVNSYMKAARSLAGLAPVGAEQAREVIEDLCSTTLDGLTESMQIVLRYLYLHCARTSKGEVVYSASVNTLATAAGHGRDTKAISLLVEPYLLQRGLLQVLPTGRTLTHAGVERARQLIGG